MYTLQLLADFILRGGDTSLTETTSFTLQTQDTMHTQTGLHITTALDEAHPNNQCYWHPLQTVLVLANRNVILLHGNTGRWLKYTDVYGEY